MPIGSITGRPRYSDECRCTPSRFTAALAGAVLVLVLALSGASPARAQGAIVEELPKAVIDADRVTRDLEGKVGKTGEVTIWSFEERAKTSKVASPPVPMFLPSEVAADLSDGAEVAKNMVRESGGEDGGTRIMNFDDEYFVVRQYGKYRVTVQGTSKVFSTESEGERKTSADAPAPDYPPAYSATYAGAQVNFGYAGAHYLVEFECNEGEEDKGGDCVGEEEALRIVKSMALCSPELQCTDNGTDFIQKK